MNPVPGHKSQTTVQGSYVQSGSPLFTLPPRYDPRTALKHKADLSSSDLGRTESDKRPVRFMTLQAGLLITSAPPAQYLSIFCMLT